MNYHGVQTLKRHREDWFREDPSTLLDLLAQEKIKPVIAARTPLLEAVRAHELLATGSLVGKIVLTCAG